MPRTLPLLLALLAPAALAQGSPFADVSAPWGLLQLEDGRVLVSSSVLDDVAAFESDGTPLGTFASGLDFPYAMTQQADGTVLVTATESDDVRAYAPDGTPAGWFTGDAVTPTGILALADGRVLVAELVPGQVSAFTAGGDPLGVFAAGLPTPTSVLQLQDGRVLVVEGSTSRVLAYAPDGTALGTFAELAGVSRGAVLTDGSVLLVVGGGSGRLVRYAADGTPLGELASGLDSPTGLAALSDGRVLVGLEEDDEVRAFDGPPAVDLRVARVVGPRDAGDPYKLLGAIENATDAPLRIEVLLEVAAPSGLVVYSTSRRFGRLGAGETYGPRKLFEIPLGPGADPGEYTATVTVLEGKAATPLDGEATSFTVAAGARSAPTAGLEAPASGPNPFRASTTLRYRLGAPGPVDLRVFDAAGREVAVLEASTQPAGDHAAVFEAGALPAGVYVWRLEADGRVTTGRLSLVR